MNDKKKLADLKAKVAEVAKAKGYVKPEGGADAKPPLVPMPDYVPAKRAAFRPEKPLPNPDDDPNYKTSTPEEYAAMKQAILAKFAPATRERIKLAEATLVPTWKPTKPKDDEP